MPNTTLGYPYPAGGDATDVPGDVADLAAAVDASPGIASLTGAAITALSAPLKRAGRTVWNQTTQRLNVLDGTNALPLAWLSEVVSKIDQTIVDAKGDLIAGTAADTVARLPVGANGTQLTADSTAATGMAWKVVDNGLNPFLLMGA